VRSRPALSFRGGAQRASPHLSSWPFLCWAVVVGLMVAGEVARLYHAKSSRPPPPATGAFGTSRSSEAPTAVQHARAQEPGRGRDAETPWQIPWKGWKDICWRTYQQTGENRLLAVAAGVVFYGLLAVFPAVTALVSLYGLFASPAAIGDDLSSAAGVLPQGSIDILRDHITQLMAGGGAKLGFGFVFGLAVALWSANAGMKAIIDALNVVYEEQEKRGTGRELRTDPPPDHGTVLDVPLVTGRTVKARIGPFYREGSVKQGTALPSVTEVYADEI
jgi:membrane protein